MSDRSIRRIVLLAALVLCASARGAYPSTVVDFDDLTIAPPRFVGMRGDHYRSHGVHFSFVDSLAGTTHDSVWVVPSGFAGHGATSSPNSAALWGGTGQRLRAEFVDPVSGSPASVDFVSVMVGDDSGEPDLITLEGFDGAGTLLGRSQFFSPFAGAYGLVSLAVPGIRRVELYEPTSGADLDDFTIGTLTKVDVGPETGDPGVALERPYPQPLVVGSVRLGFALRDHSPATLEVLDVAGRRRSVREVGSLGPGRHSVALADAERLGAGLYFVRLRQGSVVRSVRLVVAR